MVEDQNQRLKCDCGPHLKSYYWIPDGKCYPHYQQGMFTKVKVFLTLTGRSLSALGFLQIYRNKRAQQWKF